MYGFGLSKSGENKAAAQMLINYGDLFFLCCSWSSKNWCLKYLYHYRINLKHVLKFNLNWKKISDQPIFWNTKFVWGAWANGNEYINPSLIIVIYAVNLNNHHQGSADNKNRDFLPRKAFQAKGKGACLGTSTKGIVDQDTVLYKILFSKLKKAFIFQVKNIQNIEKK